MEVDPAPGGRITSLKMGNSEFLFLDRSEILWGSVFWTTPQSWPPTAASVPRGLKPPARSYFSSMQNERVYRMTFASVYPLYVQKAAKKGRTQAEVDTVIRWLTGYTAAGLKRQIGKQVDFETFFAEAPGLNPNAAKITGMICGYRVEEIEDGLMRKIRYLDKLVDELAKGKAMEKILRT
jgi:hypothetical protein